MCTVQLHYIYYWNVPVPAEGSIFVHNKNWYADVRLLHTQLTAHSVVHDMQSYTYHTHTHTTHKNTARVRWFSGDWFAIRFQISRANNAVSRVALMLIYNVSKLSKTYKTSRKVFVIIISRPFCYCLCQTRRCQPLTLSKQWQPHKRFCYTNTVQKSVHVTVRLSVFWLWPINSTNFLSNWRFLIDRQFLLALRPFVRIICLSKNNKNRTLAKEGSRPLRIHTHANGTLCTVRTHLGWNVCTLDLLTQLEQCRESGSMAGSFVCVRASLSLSLCVFVVVYIAYVWRQACFQHSRRLSTSSMIWLASQFSFIL